MILRPATWEDRQLLLTWRNDPGTIRSLSRRRPVLVEEHEVWMRQRITRPHFYIAEAEGGPIGTVRLDPHSVISVTIAPESRGQGFAAPLITKATYCVDHPILAQVGFNNLGSIHAFLKAGFRAEPGQWYRK